MAQANGGLNGDEQLIPAFFTVFTVLLPSDCDRRLSPGYLTVIDRGRAAALCTRISAPLPPAMPRRRSGRRLEHQLEQL
jgi:hypothetical protein